MTKHEFFKELKFGLRNAEFSDVEELLDYYDELIMERKELGEKEEDIIDSFDSVSVIVENFHKQLSKKEKAKKIGRAHEIAIEEPSAKNFGKAVGSTFLLPVKIPVAIILGILLVIVSAATFALVTAVWAAIGGVIVGGIAYTISALIVGFGAQNLIIALLTFISGALCAAFGFFLITPAKVFTKAMFKLSALIVKGMVRLFGGKKKSKASEEV